jgi:hypothetical protein
MIHFTTHFDEAGDNVTGPNNGTPANDNLVGFEDRAVISDASPAFQVVVLVSLSAAPFLLPVRSSVRRE